MHQELFARMRDQHFSLTWVANTLSLVNKAQPLNLGLTNYQGPNQLFVICKTELLLP